MNTTEQKRLSEAENILQNVLSTLEEWFETEEERGSIYLEIKEFLNIETEENERDLFENYDELPQEVKNILEQFLVRETEGIDGYENCEQLVKELNLIGYTCDYYLQAEPFNLRKILN